MNQQTFGLKLHTLICDLNLNIYEPFLKLSYDLLSGHFQKEKHVLEIDKIVSILKLFLTDNTYEDHFNKINYVLDILQSDTFSLYKRKI